MSSNTPLDAGWFLAIDELNRLGEQIVPAFSQFSQKPPSQENALLFVSTFVSFLTWYFATLSRFKKVVRPAQIVSSPVSPNATTSGGRTTG